MRKFLRASSRFPYDRISNGHGYVYFEPVEDYMYDPVRDFVWTREAILAYKHPLAPIKRPVDFLIEQEEETYFEQELKRINDEKY